MVSKFLVVAMEILGRNLGFLSGFSLISDQNLGLYLVFPRFLTKALTSARDCGHNFPCRKRRVVSLNS
ncbi:hypothetical protein XENTR_v10020272 [Xenopus tropicalis]|nr:hypothetical protein XENTR_v10020272 [Xenopus tropicalis]